MATLKKDSEIKHIVVTKNGPYLVFGSIPLRIPKIVSNKEGMSWDWEEGKTFVTGKEYGLCRCGQSKKMPFCDNSLGTFNGFY